MKALIKEQLSRFVPLIILLIASGILSFWVRDFVREVIVRPLLLAMWYSSLILRSFPDTFFWILFILVFSLIAIRSLLAGPKGESTRRRENLVLGGPVSTWSRLINHSKAGGYSEWQLSQSLCKLTWRLLQDERSKSMRQIEDGLRSQVLDLPSDIQAYFEAGLLPYQPISNVKRRLGLDDDMPALGLDPGQVVDYVEANLDPLGSKINNLPGELE